jgi:hypothetical protein
MKILSVLVLLMVFGCGRDDEEKEDVPPDLYKYFTLSTARIAEWDDNTSVYQTMSIYKSSRGNLVLGVYKSNNNYYIKSTGYLFIKDSDGVEEDYEPEDCETKLIIPITKTAPSSDIMDTVGKGVVTSTTCKVVEDNVDDSDIVGRYIMLSGNDFYQRVAFSDNTYLQSEFRVK